MGPLWDWFSLTMLPLGLCFCAARLEQYVVLLLALLAKKILVCWECTACSCVHKLLLFKGATFHCFVFVFALPWGAQHPCWTTSKQTTAWLRSGPMHARAGRETSCFNQPHSLCLITGGALVMRQPTAFSFLCPSCPSLYKAGHGVCSMYCMPGFFHTCFSSVGNHCSVDET